MKIPNLILMSLITAIGAACADDMVCAQVITIAKNKQGICRVFKDACLPAEYERTEAKSCNCDKLEFSPELSHEFQTSYCKDTAANRDIFVPRIIGEEQAK